MSWRPSSRGDLCHFHKERHIVAVRAMTRAKGAGPGQTMRPKRRTTSWRPSSRARRGGGGALRMLRA